MTSAFLDAIASPNTYPRQWVSQWLIVSDLEIAVASSSLFYLIRNRILHYHNMCFTVFIHSSSYDITDLRTNAMQSNGHCIAMVGGASWARERDNNWSGFSSTRDPFALWCNSGSSLSGSFTIKTKQFLHLCHLIAFPLRQWSRWNNLGIWDSDKGGYLISGKTPRGGMGDSHPRKPGMTPWGGNGSKYFTLIYRQMWDQVWRHSRQWQWKGLESSSLHEACLVFNLRHSVVFCAKLSIFISFSSGWRNTLSVTMCCWFLKAAFIASWILLCFCSTHFADLVGKYKSTLAVV